MVDLPEELLVEILSWLPVEPLVRLKCVCKSWYSLIENEKFVTKHMVKQSKDHVVLMHNAGGNFMSFLSNSGDVGDDVSCIMDLDLDLKCPSHWHEFECGSILMHGYCDGIVVLSDFQKDITVCNPAIRELRFLPISDTFDCYISGPNPLHVQTNSIGFGYDPKSEDYKVIRIMAFWMDDSYSIVLPSKAEVFALRTDSNWREIKSVVGAQVWYNYDLEQYFDGIHYWCGEDDDTQKLVVLSFDMADEVFHKSPVPDVCDNLNDNKLFLGIFKNESIALFVQPSDGFEKCIDVWGMKEFGVRESWTKKLTIGPLLGLERPLVFWKNDNELLQEDADGELVSYTLATLESKKLPTHYEFNWSPSNRAYRYMKTLVSVNRREDT